MTRLDLEPRHVVGIVCLGGLAFAPFLLDVLTVRQLQGALFLGMFAMSWDYVSGYTGQLSFGHSMFFAAGGYTATLVNLHLGVTPVLAIVVGTAVAGLLGIIVGFPALRLRGPYLALITLIIPLILVQIANIFPGILGGEAGLRSPDSLVTIGDTVASILTTIGFRTPFDQEVFVYYYISLFFFLGIFTLFYVFTRSYVGEIFTAIREDEDAVLASGINPAKFKVFSFTMSGAVGGFAGAAFVHTGGSPSPDALLLVVVSIEVVLISILGGMGTITGPAAIGIAYYFVRDFLQTTFSHVSMVIFFTLALLVLFFLPKGLIPGLGDLSRKILELRDRRANPTT
ncbi:branched-chain amino acid ABC transporter permease [Halostagnicola sp. A56]|uniref:branched-chain amino acid ABC transporter permease n=1 Tax=Halostagnicola sp. A56 TaxID=1495067 RepID=UPI0004A006C9|nr:branched-chain amino acid ABC transporter permease [Halostagnicola sp. A56]